MKKHGYVLLGLICLLPGLAHAEAVEATPARAMRVAGTFTTHVVACKSLCTESQYKGDLDGRSEFTLISLEPTRVPNVSRYVGRLVLHTADGDLYGQDVGLWDTKTGRYTDTWRIEGGTGAFEGAFGVLYLQGTLDPVTGTGSSSYRGWIDWRCHDDVADADDDL